jgi:hypothetical protein
VQDFATTTAPHKRGLRWNGAWFWHVAYILYSVEVGGVLLFLPWMQIWENNYLVFQFPELRPFISNPFLKGAVLGLGIVNIIIGIQELAHFRKASRTYVSG